MVQKAPFFKATFSAVTARKGRVNTYSMVTRAIAIVTCLKLVNSVFGLRFLVDLRLGGGKGFHNQGVA
jgi:hypothetical protein